MQMYYLPNGKLFCFKITGLNLLIINKKKKKRFKNKLVQTKIVIICQLNITRPLNDYTTFHIKIVILAWCYCKSNGPFNSF